MTGQTCLTCNWSLRSRSFIDLHLTCMTDTALLPGHEMVLFAFEVLLLDRREVKRFSFSLAEFYWMDSSVSCRLLFSGAFLD